MALRAEFERDRRRLDPVGGPPRRHRPRVLPDREAPQPRRAARRHRLHRLLPARQGGRRLRRLVPRGGDRRMTALTREPLRRAAGAATASTCRRASRCWCARRRRPRRCCWRCSARSSSARRGRCCARRCPARPRATGRRRATSTSTPTRPPSWPRPRAPDCLLTIQAPENTSELAGVDPARLARAARARARHARARDAAPLVRDAVADAAGAQQAGLATARVRRAGASARCSSTATTRSRRGASCATRQARLIERLSGARELRIEAEGTDLRLSVEGRTWVNSDGQRNMPSGEVFTGPRRGLRRGPHPLHDPVEPARRGGRGDRAALRGGPRGRGARRPRRGVPARDARHRRGRVAARARSASARTSASTARSG